MTYILLGIHIALLIFTIIKILLDTESTPKTLAYILMVILLPVIGIIIYFSFGINYRHRKTASATLREQALFDEHYFREVSDPHHEHLSAHEKSFKHFSPMVHFLKGLNREYLWPGQFKLLINGEEKFPEVLDTLIKARKFIHMEYYAWENDTRGNQIKEVLLQKAQEGVKVRILFDDYASWKIKKNIVRQLQNGGVEIYPKIRVKLKHFANRINHRDHRKIIIVDGLYGFVGGINISDRYDNSIDTGLYWRDTHVKITGSLVSALQRHFMISWNASAPDHLSYSGELLPHTGVENGEGVRALGQVIPGGPAYPKSNIMLTYTRIFTLARKNLYITNPYFIPSEGITNALCQAAISGVDVRIMIPDRSDSMIVGAASRFYFAELLRAGVRIFLYKKGFVHAKTAVADSHLSVVGTANMDIRSFDLNLEIMAVIYGNAFALEMERMFITDIEDCREYTLEDWERTSVVTRLVYAAARLISAFL